MIGTKCEFQLQVLAAANRVYIFFFLFVGRGSNAHTQTRELLYVCYLYARSRTLFESVAALIAASTYYAVDTLPSQTVECVCAYLICQCVRA